MSDRWAAFSHGELDELALSLDHRLAEAEAGNGYVYTQFVGPLLLDLYEQHPELLFVGSETIEDVRERVRQVLADDDVPMLVEPKEWTGDSATAGRQADVYIRLLGQEPVHLPSEITFGSLRLPPERPMSDQERARALADGTMVLTNPPASWWYRLRDRLRRR